MKNWLFTWFVIFPACIFCEALNFIIKKSPTKIGRWLCEKVVGHTLHYKWDGKSRIVKGTCYICGEKNVEIHYDGH